METKDQKFMRELVEKYHNNSDEFEDNATDDEKEAYIRAGARERSRKILDVLYPNKNEKEA
ncbi:MAG: hypothetical protein LKG79_07930 [Furfurilactobacillus sp.]|jgi:hypothetical protein|uniref:Uncharacterized protein n=1 Tax=Furfurilactobacillus milii TaxID=2888272 RepID=A0ABT6DCD3_9LACO|nr:MULTISPECIES: hypothetical protein [Furfurilactobacillus]QLE65681.1 hypothetical protein LROSL2_0328 [Furfurilactobacillus rossiae]MCF6161839.1 hypothetical protein [Furfurilactobacillus milii]MCF6164219.1 hypothetical protein [Furfurilactobacillus milii]MCF6420038.1 hypothetical protein [Furfurilactobacillus milii]MCH4012208.1 hypothetical protein [Furfurilactobacillus sp.]